MRERLGNGNESKEEEVETIEREVDIPKRDVLDNKKEAQFFYNRKVIHEKVRYDCHNRSVDMCALNALFRTDNTNGNSRGVRMILSGGLEAILQYSRQCWRQEVWVRCVVC
jgi:hypothetical protein